MKPHIPVDLRSVNTLAEKSTIPENPSGGEEVNHAIFLIDPRLLKPHPEINGFEHTPEEDDLFLSELALDGQVFEPIRITRENQILDGRHRVKGAIKLGFKTVPVFMDEDADNNRAQALALSSAVVRRQLTAQGKALVIYLAHPELRAERKARRDRNLRRGKEERQKSELTYAQLAARYRVDPKFLTYCAKIHDMCPSEEHWRERQMDILSGNATIQYLYNGEKGRQQTGKKRTDPNRFELLKTSLGTDIRNRFQGWSRYEKDLDDPVQRRKELSELVSAFSDTFRHIPNDFLQCVAKKIKDHLATHPTVPNC